MLVCPGPFEGFGFERSEAQNMPVCHSHRFAFVHVQKAAGASFNAALTSAGLTLEYCYERGVIDLFEGHSHGLDLLRRFRYDYPFASLSGFAQSHLPAVVLRELVGVDVWDEYFTFAFVRNPWDRMVSTYHYLKTLMSKPWAKERHPDNYAMIERSPDFASFLRWSRLTENDMTSLLVDNNGVQLVDVVGRFERLAEDVARISERIGIPLELPHLNTSEHNDYRGYYTPATQAIVARNFARDIERFEYVF